MFQLQCEKGIVTGTDGICYDYKGRPMISILVKGDQNGNWNQGDFLLDTGADGTFLHSDEAVRLGLNIDSYDKEGTVKGIDGIERPAYYKEGMLIKIGHFPHVPLTIGFSSYVRPGLRILGRRTILRLFGIAFNDNEIGIFAKREI
ncbi:MAG: aspartyl protease family protein [bacterium]|nr:aspartyl protease family protein [bacterium]